MSTPEANNSLILPGEEQLDLIPQSEIMKLELEREEEAGVFTGERLFKQDHPRYVDCVNLLAESYGIRRIARLLSMSPSTVRAVRDREPDAIDTVKERIATLAKHGVEMTAEAILEDLDDDTIRKKISTRDKSIILGVLAEKYLLMAGQATSIVDIRSAEPEHNDFNAYVASLKQADAVTTGNSGEAGKQKGDPVQVLPSGSIDASFVEPEAVAPGATEDGSGIPHVVDEGQNEDK